MVLLIPNLRRLGAAALSAAMAATLLTAGGVAATAPTTPFSQCPAIGSSPSCGILIEFTDSGTNIYADSSVGPYDGIEDTLVGVVNNSTAAVPSVHLVGVGTFLIGIFAFDGDGHCSGFYPFTGDGYCAGVPTGYEGPANTFANISTTSAFEDTGDVVFTGGLAVGASTYFSLEDSLTATSISTSNTAVSYTGPASVQYSDPLALSGHLQTSAGTAIAGESLGFVLGTDTKTAGPTDVGGNATATTYNELQQPGSATSVVVSFAGDALTTPPLNPSSSTSAFTINKEDCTLAYTGDTLVNASVMTNLSAQFGEPDTTPGDWTGKTVTFTLTDAALNVTTYTATTNAAGVAATTAALGPNVYAVGVTFAGDDFYLPCASSADTLVTVQAANAKITGGGWISQTVGRTNFGFNVIRDVTGLKGQLQVRVRNGKDRFHSTSVLTLNSSGNTGTWTGLGRWNGVNGYTFTVSVVDNGTSGKKGDTISIVIKSPTNATVFTTSGPQPLKGGNIVVH